MFERAGHAVRPFPVAVPERAGRAAPPTAAPPPDLSLIAKARGVERGFPQFIFDIFTQYQEDGPDYIHALLTGYDEEPPAGMAMPPGTPLQPVLSRPRLAMPKPLSRRPGDL